jgi:hypothetical protein
MVVSAFFILGLFVYFIHPYVEYETYKKTSIEENMARLLNNEFCIFRFERDGVTVAHVDKDILDGCTSKLKFSSDTIYIKMPNNEIVANYSLLGKYKIKIWNSNDTLLNNSDDYSLSITDKGVNIFGDDLTTVLAYRIP